MPMAEVMRLGPIGQNADAGLPVETGATFQAPRHVALLERAGWAVGAVPWPCS